MKKKRKSESNPGPSKILKIDNITCDDCNVQFNNRKQYIAHLKSLNHINKKLLLFGENVFSIKTSFKNRIASYRIMNSSKASDIVTFLNNSKINVINLWKQHLLNQAIKINIELFANYIKPTSENHEIKSFQTKYVIANSISNLEEIYDELCAIINKKSEEFQVNLKISQIFYFLKNCFIYYRNEILVGVYIQ